MRSLIRRKWGAGLAGLVSVMCVAVLASAAQAASYEFDPVLTLTGDCSTGPSDLVQDPSCPYPAPPNGPTGRFDRPRAVTIDAFGNEFIATAGGLLEIFDDEGKFIAEASVPKAISIAVDSKGNLYVFENTGGVVRYPPSEYEPEAGKIDYKNPAVPIVSGFPVGAVAVDTDPAHLDQLLLAQQSTITRYSSAQAGNAVINSTSPSGLNWPYGLAIDSQRRLIYVSFCKDEAAECAIKVLSADAPYGEVDELDGSNTPAGEFIAASGRLGIAVDEQIGTLLVADVGAKIVYQFDEEYAYVSQFGFTDFADSTSVQIAISNGTKSPSACGYPDPGTIEIAPGDACNRHYLFVPAFKAKGYVAAYHPPGETTPDIEGVLTAGIGRTEAELQATIVPGGLETTYHFEITTLASWEAEEFNGATPLGEGTISADGQATEVSAFVTGLTPGETYRFRVVAENALGEAQEEGQNESTFATYDDAAISSGCSNQPLRTGFSALLPDCRAYELVSPADTNGRPPKGVGFIGSTFTTVQASPGGDAVSFKIEGGSIPGSSGVGSFEGDPYIARRQSTGWVTKLAGPTGDEATVSAPASTSPDQGYSFWTARVEGPLVINERSTEYLYYPDGHSELIGRGSEGTDPIAVGKLITEDATHVIFETINLAPTVAVKLEPNAPPTGTEAVYDRTIDPVTKAEETHTVSLLPGNVTPAAGENATYQGASIDGEGIAFTLSTKPSEGEATLYLRLGNETTYEIGEEVEFAGVSKGGDRIFYVEGGDLEAFDTSSEEVIAFSSTGDVTPVNVSSNGTRAYFVSPSVLGATNPQGDSAQPGEQNLYLSEDGQISFVATVALQDVADGLGRWTEVVSDQVALDPSRTNPPGSVLLFQSRAEITGYPASEFPQIYRYDTGGELQCISCIPTVAPATGGASLESYTLDSFSPRPFSPNGFVPNLNPEGTRVFFESTEALVSTDSDKVIDVYEWEANGVGGCQRGEGCLYLISTGQSARDNFLYGHSASGDDVFFTTGDQLTGWDTSEGSLSIYDAKVGGGFPEPDKSDPCLGDGCRPTTTPAPDFGKPEAGGEGNVPPQPKTCPKGKRKVKQNGKVRCVKKQKKQKGKGKAKQRAGANRGAGK